MEFANLSVKLWPPTQNTRQNLVERMTKNLVTPSIWSRKYGLLSQKEAEEDAKQIELAAFESANQHFIREPHGDGSSAVQLYAKESGRLMIEVIKRGPVTKSEEEPNALEIPVTKVDKETSILLKLKQCDGTAFDISGEPRTLIGSGDAEKLLKSLEEPGNKYTKICFSNTSFGTDAALVAEPILSSLKDQLTEVDLSDFVAGRQEEEALEVMKIFSLALEGSKLTNLNLSNNALGEKGIMAFEALLKSQHNLEKLYLMNDGISLEAAIAVSDLIPSTDKLKVLHFHNNMTEDEGAIAISKIVKNSPLLEDFRCSSTRVGSEGGIALTEALEKCNHLKKLDIRDNMFGIDAGLALSKTLSLFSDLSEIYLSYLNLEDEGSIALVNALKESALSLEVLDMAGNEITVKAAPALASCIASKQFLSVLNLSENELKDEGTILIAKALEEGHGQLCDVDLSTNMMRRAGARCLAQAVVSKPGLKLLNINGNYISDEGIDEVRDVFKNCPGVLGLLDENDPEGEEYDDEEEAGESEDELEGSISCRNIQFNNPRLCRTHVSLKKISSQLSRQRLCLSSNPTKGGLISHFHSTAPVNLRPCKKDLMHVRAASAESLNFEQFIRKFDDWGNVLPNVGSTEKKEVIERKPEAFRSKFLNFARFGSIINNAAESFFKSEIRRRLVVTALLLVISRLGYFIPLPGFDRRLMPENYLSFISGSVDELGDLMPELKLSAFQLGISPQIAASILMQVLYYVVTSLVKLRKEGLDGHEKIKSYIWWISLGFAVVEAIILSIYSLPYSIYATSYRVKHVMITTSFLVCGAMTMTWICDKISESGFGQGSSLIICVSILTGYMDTLYKMLTHLSGEHRTGRCSLYD